MNYARSLEYEQRPNYNKLRGLFERVLAQNGWEMDFQYDWIIKKKQKDELFAIRTGLKPPEEAKNATHHHHH